jgi:hypothetical protein
MDERAERPSRSLRVWRIAEVAIIVAGAAALLVFVVRPLLASDPPTSIISPIECPRPGDATAWWWLLRAAEMPTDWLMLTAGPAFLASNDKAACERAEPAGRTGYAETLWSGKYPDPTGRDFTVEEKISVFDTEAQASAFAAKLASEERAGGTKSGTRSLTYSGTGVLVAFGYKDVRPATRNVPNAEVSAYSVRFGPTQNAEPVATSQEMIMRKGATVLRVSVFGEGDVEPPSELVDRFAMHAADKIGLPIPK